MGRGCSTTVIRVQITNQVWAADITYVSLPQGFMYLVADMDWFSRFVLGWQLSNTLNGVFCLATLRRALRDGRPDIFNTDQGVQFTAQAFTDELEAAGIRVSMDGRGRFVVLILGVTLDETEGEYCQSSWLGFKSHPQP